MEKRKASLGITTPVSPHRTSPEWDALVSDSLKKLNIATLSESQKIVLNTIHSRTDCLAVLPTGSGKSLCYILPSLTMRKSVVVISPLISLMHDQIEQLGQYQIKAVAYDYLQTTEEQQAVTKDILSGHPMIIYVSPERFLSDRFSETLRQIQIGLIAVDEAHCVVKWGFQFRQKYRKLGAVLKTFGHVPKLALTATATKETRDDIENLLGLTNPVIVTASPLRENLNIQAEKCNSVGSQQLVILDIVERSEGQGIVYVPTKKIALQLSNWLQGRGISSNYYHGDCSASHRKNVYRNFFDKTLKVIVATSAFGMGVNKPDIRFIVHAGPPKDLESYLQEIGRAGRDGLPSDCYVVFTSRDYALNKFMLDATLPSLDITLNSFHIANQVIQSYPEISEHDLIDRIAEELKVKKKLVKSSLELLIREQVIKRWTDIHDASHQLFEIGTTESREDIFWDEYSTRRALAFKNLSEMHHAVAQDSLRESIMKYFS